MSHAQYGVHYLKMALFCVANSFLFFPDMDVELRPNLQDSKFMAKVETLLNYQNKINNATCLFHVYSTVKKRGPF